MSFGRLVQCSIDFQQYDLLQFVIILCVVGVLICCSGCAYLVHVCFVTFVLILLSFIGLCFCCLSLCVNFSVLFLCFMILDGGCGWVLLVMQHSLIRLFSSRVFFALFCGQTCFFALFFLVYCRLKTSIAVITCFSLLLFTQFCFSYDECFPEYTFNFAGVGVYTIQETLNIPFCCD